MSPQFCRGASAVTLKRQWDFRMLHLSGFRMTASHNKVFSVCKVVQKGKGHMFSFDFPIHLVLTFRKVCHAVLLFVQAQHPEIYLG